MAINTIYNLIFELTC